MKRNAYILLCCTQSAQIRLLFCRQFIPPKQRARFDEFHKYQRANMINFEEEASKLDHAHTERRYKTD